MDPAGHPSQNPGDRRPGAGLYSVEAERAAAAAAAAQWAFEQHHAAARQMHQQQQQQQQLVRECRSCARARAARTITKIYNI